jgi:hypothetical protein
MNLSPYRLNTAFYVVEDVFGGMLFREGDTVVIEYAGFLENHYNSFVYRFFSLDSGKRTTVTETFFQGLEDDGLLVLEKGIKRRKKEKDGRAGHPLTEIFK